MLRRLAPYVCRNGQLYLPRAFFLPGREIKPLPLSGYNPPSTKKPLKSGMSFIKFGNCGGGVIQITGLRVISAIILSMVEHILIKVSP